MNRNIESREESINLSLFDFPGFNQCHQNSYSQLLVNYTNERMFHFMNYRTFVLGNDEYELEGVREYTKIAEYLDNTRILDMFMKPSVGLFSVIDKVVSDTHQMDFDPQYHIANNPDLDIAILGQLSHVCGSLDREGIVYTQPKKNNLSFQISHFVKPVIYCVNGFSRENYDALGIDVVNIFRGFPVNNPSSDTFHLDLGAYHKKPEYYNGSVNPFIRQLFGQRYIRTRDTHVRGSFPVDAMQTLDSISPALGTEKSKEELPLKTDGELRTNLTMFQGWLADTISHIDKTKVWFVISLNPNRQKSPVSFDFEYVLQQVKCFGLEAIAQKKSVDLSINLKHDAFFHRYSDIPEIKNIYFLGKTSRDKCVEMGTKLQWKKSEYVVGKTKCFYSFELWKRLEMDHFSRERLNASAFALHTQGTDIPIECALSVNSQDDNDRLCDIDERHDSVIKELTYLYYGVVDNNSNIMEYDEYDGYNQKDPELKLNSDSKVHEFYGGGGANHSDSANSFGKPKQLCNDQNATHGKVGALEKNITTEAKLTKTRKYWLFVVWFTTWWIPSPVIKYFSNFRLEEQVISWREKVTLCVFIFLCCCMAVFWIAVLGILICPKQSSLTLEELKGHNTASNALISIRGEIFDIKDFTHVGVDFKTVVEGNYLGTDLTNLFPLQLSFVCAGLVSDPRLALSAMADPYTDAWLHDHRYYKHPEMVSGGYNHYQYRIMRMLRNLYSRGQVSIDPKKIQKMGKGTDKGEKRYWAVISQQVFDLTDYINYNGAPYVLSPPGVSNQTASREFLDENVKNMFQVYSGMDITERWNRYFRKNKKSQRLHYNCLRGAYYAGIVDHRTSFQCYFANYVLLASSVALASVILFKFLAALQLSPKRDPEEHSNFVVCNIPCYTEGEESLRLTIDSIATLKYDDKRKLLFIICDGLVMGTGNDRPTPRIVLDILNSNHNNNHGHNQDYDTNSFDYISLGEGFKKHNKGKVFSGLYQISGHVVPYLVVVKHGNKQEHIKQGNRGKRDSQIILMNFFNRVHFNLKMTPLELEIYHQIKNVIGVDPAYYEFVMMVDADTYVYPESLNRMVSCMVHDSKLMGLCGETMLANEKATWVTMIQVYEYYISHHLSKAFESLFGSVTCLPGCFSMYRLRTPETNQPLLISNQIIQEYSESKVDTLHKKNLLSLGEDRYLTTLMLKHLPYNKTKFTPDAQCRTNAPDSWQVVWVLLLLDAVCGTCRPAIDVDYASHGGVPRVHFVSVVYINIAGSNGFHLLDGSNLFTTSTFVHYKEAVAEHWLDDSVYFCDTSVFVFHPDIFVLAF
ncbi:Chitin synthase 8 [Zancudomyces culisetae]|uniref:chitin synthase n=1 Tax=Zancudomyces culisetae TaxID=1213189 RepID=A0A1R1PFX9_ZANCU|nr:Chitin synthase 8 [Zancudomyces culisetae]|eukprot:OMH79884.1 Chitin synthase 8 [Zancudomyces culisetae]